MRWWCWRELRGDGDLPIYLEGGHLVQGTHNIDGGWWGDPGQRESLVD